ncbi:glycosyltransferase [Bordetella pseudohinzii]|uniref:Glycosyl transferase family 1 n=3 Tax=Bordetella pseudohinzii TaxID=1331258 RepID=A0ABM6DJF2_9BORD|nr:glycosyl transferase family 1 [Bordetella pseudohinzii]ANY18012.1 glycosyl transferase family 1 [Bordetella pseudohinzii]KMM26329.1 glycosyl transferase family 1 [Bordetella pseudohinzii]KXA79557.1 glycosyl transferase family 1 [Bordetella pseudohinzii]KXA80864.1 glycosyl transferase family 1 [Bordetella pseudohinzii]
MNIREVVFGEFFKRHPKAMMKYVLEPLHRARRRIAPRRAVLFCGQSYYHAWYLSRELRRLGWQADVLNWDLNPASQIYYHGHDFHFADEKYQSLEAKLDFFFEAIDRYDIFHFANIGGLSFGFQLSGYFKENFWEHFEIDLLRALGKKIVYSNTGCMDGVSQTSFSQWGPISPCASCNWRNHPEVCSDEGNLTWARFRNSVADYQCNIGGNRADYNDDPRVHEAPGFYCLDKDLWRPDLEIPEAYRLEDRPGVVRLYHVIGNKDARTDKEGTNIKSSHIYVPLIERLRAEGHDVEHLSYHHVPNREIRFYQAQADIVLDMLTFGFFGANGREALMLGKPLVCFIRPEWLESMRVEFPEYVDELPVVQANPGNVYQVVKRLIENRDEREEIGRRSRAFAVKWHSSHAGARHFDRVYAGLLRGRRLLRKEPTNG